MTTDLAFGRVYKVTAFAQNPKGTLVGDHPEWFEELGNGLVITDFDIKFKIKRTLKAEPNAGEITIYNLNQRSRDELETLPRRVIFEAGHDELLRLVFAGDLKKGSGSVHDGVDWVTTLRLGDGHRAFANARVNFGYSAGTPLKTIIKDIAATMDLSLPKDFEASPAVNVQLSTFEAATGFSSDELTRVLAPYGYHWSQQNQKMTILRDEEVNPNIIRLVDDQNGMIGTPKRSVPDKNGASPTVTFQVLLSPEFNPGDKVQLRSKAVNGLFKITEITEEGDFSGNDWTTTCEGTPTK